MSLTSTPRSPELRTSSTLREDDIRVPLPIVVAAIELPEEEMWRLWLRVKKYDIQTPVDRGRRLWAALQLGDFVRRYGFRFTVFGDGDGTIRYILVTQSKWFHKGYRGMPEDQIPYYPGPGKCEEYARVFLKKCKVQGVDELPYRTLLVPDDPALH